MDIAERDINAVCFGILCNFPQFCGEERAKEAAELVRALYAERETLRADVAPVRRGRWIKPVPGDGENYCSVCKAEQLWFYGYGYLESNYCPNCGARMEREDEHETD